jgi:hypothetical protein
MSSPKAEVLCNNDLRSMIVSFANTKCGKCINCRRRIQATRDNWRHIKACEARTDDDFHQYHKRRRESCYSPDLTHRTSGTGIVINGYRTEVCTQYSTPYQRQTYDSDEERLYVPDCTVQ